jgi:hypothetical protein
MKQSILICIGMLTVALTVNAQTPYKATQKKAPQRTTTYHANRGAGTVRQASPRSTFSPARSSQRAFSSSQRPEPTFRAAHRQPRMNTSFAGRRVSQAGLPASRAPVMRNRTAWRQTRPSVSSDSRQFRFNERPQPRRPSLNRFATSDVLDRRDTRVAVANDLRRDGDLRERPRSSSAFRNRPERIDDIAGRRQTGLATANDWRGSRLSERQRESNSLLKPFAMNDVVARRETRAEFNNKWAESNFRREARTSIGNRSLATTTEIREQRRAAFSNNWRGDWFAGRQYGAFRNYQRQWHDSGWWHHHCDRIVFVTVYSQPFPFYFDAGYWYPAWGYYSEAYYPYDGPIYCYNDLPPDEIITNVQIQLYDEGYYDGPIDGILGPETRAAIADYQADHGLAVTAAIDEPTVESLGLT